jgi:hypothetical protein
MKKAALAFAVVLILGALLPDLRPQAPPAKGPTPWILNDQEYFERPGVSVLVFHDYYPEGRQGGLEIIQHGERVAALGDVRLEAVPGQWGLLPSAGQRVIDRDASRAEVPARFEKSGIAYRVRVEPDGEALRITVDFGNSPAGLASTWSSSLRPISASPIVSAARTASSPASPTAPPRAAFPRSRPRPSPKGRSSRPPRRTLSAA